MEQNPAAATLWRMWVDTKRRIVSLKTVQNIYMVKMTCLV